MKLFVLFAFTFTLFSCSSVEFEVKEFNPVANFEFEGDTLQLDMDLSNAVLKGIVLPSENGSEKYFHFTFQIKNSGNQPQAFYYKIYYQNESYKRPEWINDEDGDLIYNQKSTQNFYGSWEQPRETFHETQLIPVDDEFHTVKDSFRIVGNPRDELRYYGGDTENLYVTEEDIHAEMEKIYATPEWMERIEEKAKMIGITVEKQVYRDAMWIIEHANVDGTVNNRWKRNPRVGTYSFMLVVTDFEGKELTPENVVDISVGNYDTTGFLNPYFYFLNPESSAERTYVNLSDNVLNTKAVLNPSSGVYVDRFNIYDVFSTEKTNEYCSADDELFSKAHFKQFFHAVHTDYPHENIPLVYDVTGENYTMEEYKNGETAYKRSELFLDPSLTSTVPCNTVGYSSEEDAVFIRNRGNLNSDHPVKENVGVSTRIGMSYGKFRAKIKFPLVLSEDGVWNGLTCAFWLFIEDDEEWNSRDLCETGYIPKHLSGEANRVDSTFYSEIDIEIVKAGVHWPKTSYPAGTEVPVDDGLNRNIIVSCTNWDMACRDTKDYIVGARDFNDDELSFTLHRWDDWHKALTIKTETEHDGMMGNEFWYEIEWKPDQITWRVGKDKKHMKTLAYVHEDYSKIPNNQMIAIVSQEFHHSSWWPTAPFDQNLIPFPKNDIYGYIYSMEIE